MTDSEPRTPAALLDLERLGPRARRRAAPRASVAVAASGSALAVLGALLIGGDAAGRGDSIDRLPGFLLTAAVVVGGFLLQRHLRAGPPATAGTVAVLVGVPSALWFGTTMADRHASIVPVLLLSTLAWAAAYLVGPGHGRPAYLGAAAVGLWATALEVIGHLSRLPFLWSSGFVGSYDRYEYGGYDNGTYGSSRYPELASRHTVSPTTLAIVTLVLGTAYLVASRRLDHRGLSGAATPLAAVALPAILLGLPLLAFDVHTTGTGFLAMLVGIALAAHGASVGRRITTWVGGVTAAIGAAFLLGDLTDSTSIGGLIFLVAGAGLVAAATFASRQLHEPDEMADPAGPPPSDPEDHLGHPSTW